MNSIELALGIREAGVGKLPASILEAINPLTLIEKDAIGVPIVHLLALTGHLAEVKEHLTVNILETVWGPGWTVPHTAAQTRCLDVIIEHLTEHEHLLHWEDNTGNTPVHLAAMFGTIFSLGDLLLNPSCLAQTNQLLQSPVHIAAHTSNLHQIAKVLTPELLAQKDIQNQAAYRVAELNNQITTGDEHLKKLVHRAKILNLEEKLTFDDVLEDIAQL